MRHIVHTETSEGIILTKRHYFLSDDEYEKLLRKTPEKQDDWLMGREPEFTEVERAGPHIFLNVDVSEETLDMAPDDEYDEPRTESAAEHFA